MAGRRASVNGQTLRGDAVTLERAGLALPLLSPAQFDALPADELVQRRSAELAAGQVLMQMRLAAQASDWTAVDHLLAGAQTQFAGNEWVATILSAMAEVAQSRSRERMMKEARYSSAKLNSRLASTNELHLSVSAEDGPAYLRRKPLQGKSDL